MTVVLDASAFLAYLLGEPGGEEVRDAIGGGALISAVNWAEVLSKLADAGVEPGEAARRLARERVLPGAVSVAAFDAAQALEAARLRSSTRRVGLSLGDRACLALGRVAGLEVLTAEASWAAVGLDAPRVVVIR